MKTRLDMQYNALLFVYLKFYLMCDCFIKSESWPVVGFSPHVGSTGVFGVYLNTFYPRVWSLKEVFSATNQEIGLCGFITLT